MLGAFTSAADFTRAMYTYRPISTEQEQIRLLRIKEVTGRREVLCELCDTSLHQESGLNYVAISYTWGPSTQAEADNGVTDKQTHNILCNGKSLLVTENLHKFLLRAAALPSIASRWMWIDAICINQQDESEKQSQVNLMATIYNSASLVVVWLGEDDVSARKSFDLMKALAKCSKDELRGITPKILAKSSPGSGLVANEAYWQSLADFFQRRYFTRAWIIQEVALAKERLAACGSEEVPWDTIVAASSFLTITSWTRWMKSHSGPTSSIEHQLNHTGPNFIEANRRSARAESKGLLLISLIRARRFHASNPRDKVYALLGVAGVSVKDKPRLKPVYESRSVEAVYTDAAIQILDDTEDLLLLAHAEGDAFREYVELPSWVPDWSVARAVGLGVTGYARYDASRGRPRFLQVNERNRSLVIEGFHLDNVKLAVERKEDILQGRPFPQLLKMFCSMPEHYRPSKKSTRCTYQQASEVLCRILITDTGGAGREHPAEPSFTAAGIAWLKSKIEAIAPYISPEIKAAALQRLEEHLCNADGVDADEYETTFAHAQHLRPFESVRGYCGTGSESVETGDGIWIVSGSRVPLLLRQAANGAYKIVGGAYVHGFMAGEALESNVNFEKITIV